MLFAVFKSYAKFALRLYCRRIVIQESAWLQSNGPLLLACNHPNSFLDGMILTTLFEQPVYSLARGDVFRKPWHRRVLQWLHLLPVYRTSEGVENLEHNYTTFAACKAVFRQQGIVLIFSEGSSVNEWRLRPLRKGTARLAISAWEEGIDLTVLPVALNYNPFRNFGKNVFLSFGEPLRRDSILQHRTDGKMFLTFNQQLRDSLQKRVFAIAPQDKKKQQAFLSLPLPVQKKALLLLPAAAGFLLHALYYFTAKALTTVYFNNDHFDSALAAMLALSYPFYLVLMMVLAGLVLGWIWAAFVAVLLPFTAWSLVQVKWQL